jgi:hypothetical protein
MIHRLRLTHLPAQIEPLQRPPQTQQQTPLHNKTPTLRHNYEDRRPPPPALATKSYSSSMRFKSSISCARSPSSLIICSTLRTEWSTVV